MPDQQLSLDFDRQLRKSFDRGEQLAILRHARIPKVKIVEGRKVRWVRGDAMKHVLTVISDRKEAFGAELIAKQAQISLRRAWRILKALQQLSLVAVRRDRNSAGGPLDKFFVVWSELALLCPGQVLTLKNDRAHYAQPPCPLGSTTVPTGTHHRAQVGTGSAHEAPIGSAQGSGQNDDDDDGEICFLREKGDRFFKHFGGRQDVDVRERVFRVLRLEYRGQIKSGTYQDVARELFVIKKRGALKKLRSLLYDLYRRRGYDVDKLIVAVPGALICPAAPAPEPRLPTSDP
jgi:hypothetical protein